jgi:tetratricopeptide (TPR) repeat protein
MVQCIGNALLSYTAYLHKLFWPVRLAVVYPFDLAAVTLAAVATATLIIALLTAISVMKAKTQPYLAVGWLWYLGTLVPVIGFVRIGHHAMADRYTYIPSVGIFIMVVWGVHYMVADSARRQLFAQIACGATLLVMMFLTRIQVGWWRDSSTLFTHAISTTSNNWLAYNNLGTDLMRHGETVQAIGCFRETIRIAPDYPDAHNNLGTAYETVGNTTEAIEEFRVAASLNPESPDIHFNLGLAYLLAGRQDSAVAELRILQTLDTRKAEELLTAVEGKNGKNE